MPGLTEREMQYLADHWATGHQKAQDWANLNPREQAGIMRFLDDNGALETVYVPERTPETIVDEVNIDCECPPCVKSTESDVHVPFGKDASYYDAGGLSVIYIIESKMAAAKDVGMVAAGLWYNVMKYALRWPFKGDRRKDLNKLADYACRLRDQVYKDLA